MPIALPVFFRAVPAAGYAEAFRRILPRGKVWSGPGLDETTDALAEEWARAHGRLLDVLEEADPRTADELIEGWERILGVTEPAATLAERQAECHARLVAQAGTQCQILVAAAAALGYTTEDADWAEEFGAEHVWNGQLLDALGGPVVTDRVGSVDWTLAGADVVRDPDDWRRQLTWFDGLADSASAPYVLPSGDWTIALWVHNDLGSGNGYYLEFWLNTSNRLVIHRFGGVLTATQVVGGVIEVNLIGAPLADDMWQLVVLRHETALKRLTLYQDGGQTAQGVYITLLPTTTQLTVGRYTAGGGLFHGGHLGQVGIFAGDLTARMSAWIAERYGALEIQVPVLLRADEGAADERVYDDTFTRTWYVWQAFAPASWVEILALYERIKQVDSTIHAISGRRANEVDLPT
ncbi:MAG: DUF2313 domain-containing protein [Gemmatimonadales bacterium]|jgi:hypothetical protein